MDFAKSLIEYTIHGFNSIIDSIQRTNIVSDKVMLCFASTSETNECDKFHEWFYVSYLTFTIFLYT